MLGDGAPGSVIISNVNGNTMTKADFNAYAIQALNEGWSVEPHPIRDHYWSSDVYKRGKVSIWYNDSYWIRAELIDGYYQNHQRFSTFKEAIHDSIVE